MIVEDYVSFETAKLLKEKGFDWNESPFYSEQDRDEWRQNNSYTIHNEEYNPDLPFDSETLTLVAPHVSIQMAMKWLRDVHNWTIYISPYWPEGDMRNKLTWYYDIESLIDNRSFRKSSHTDNYEEACEAAIKYCLENLI